MNWKRLGNKRARRSQTWASVFAALLGTDDGTDDPGRERTETDPAD